jgi:hypothetical protein
MAHDPWRHGIQVYAAPFPMDDFSLMTEQHQPQQPIATSNNNNSNAYAAGGGEQDAVDANAGPGTVIITTSSNEVANWSNDNSVESIVGPAAGTAGEAVVVGRHTRRNDSNMTDGSGQGDYDNHDDDDEEQKLLPSTNNRRLHQQQQQTAGMTTTTITSSLSSFKGVPIRRIRHTEVVLVDDVCIAYGRHWLRLRWPGHKGGFAGYIALGKVNEPLPWQISNSLRGTCTTTLGFVPPLSPPLLSHLGYFFCQKMRRERVHMCFHLSRSHSLNRDFFF